MRPVQTLPSSRPLWSPAALAQALGWVHRLLVACLTFGAWLVLLQVGMSITWNWFSGLLPLAAWWAWLALDPLGAAGRRPGVALVAALGVATGVCVAQMAGRGLMGWMGVALMAVAWAQWVLAVRSHSHGMQADGTRLPVLARAAVQLAGLLTAAWLAADPVWWGTRWVVLTVLWLSWALCWMGLHGQPSRPAPARPSASSQWPGFLASPTMALMMGALLLMAQWCVSVGWSYTEAVVAHGTVMLLAQAAVKAGLPRWDPLPRWVPLAGAFMVVAGAGVFWHGATWQAMLLAMALIAAGGEAQTRPNGQRHSPVTTLGLALPALLWVGHATPVRGPQAIAEALLVVAAVSAAGLWRQMLKTRRQA
jgi:hypothetical protein